ELLVGSFDGIIEIRVLVIPIGLAINHVGKITMVERKQQSLSGSRPCNPERPAACAYFASRLQSRKNLFAGGIVWALVQLFQCGCLGLRKAQIRIAFLA